ncbi:MAG: hypothetical protein ACLFPQ_05525 [Candidatus Woesearchaeota archaeon]
MVKTHTRQKRKFRMRRVNYFQKEKRPKTFKSEEEAIKYAKENSIKNYKLINLWDAKPSKRKIRIVEVEVSQ